MASETAAMTREIFVTRLISYAGAFAVGVAAFFLAYRFPTVLRLAIGWIAASLALLIRVWTVTLEGDALSTRERASAEDPGRNAALSLVLLASVFGFIAAIQLLGRTKDIAPNVNPSITIALGLLSIVTSWTLIHTAMQIRYAHMYYFECGDETGLQFPGGKEPSDLDFAYFSFVIGMTFQVSDVQVTQPSMRRLVLFHGILSFVFNTAILALTVNILSGALH